MDLIQRPRRLRGSETLRKMVRETRIDKSSLIYPLFVKEGTGVEEEIPSMEGQYRYSVDRLPFTEGWCEQYHAFWNPGSQR